MSAILAGCSGFPGMGPYRDAPARTAGVPPQGPQTASPDGDTTPAQVARLTKPVPRPKKKPPHVGGVGPEVLIGLTPGEVETLIGPPTTTTDRPPATVWLYRTDHCALSLFFYMDVGSKTFRALTFDMKGANGAAASPSHCLGQIRAVAYGN